MGATRQDSQVTDALLRKYGKVLARVDGGTSEGERNAARTIAQRMERDAPGLRAAFLGYAAKEAARDEARSRLRGTRAATEAMPRETAFDRFLHRVAAWSTDKLEELIINSADQLTEQAVGGFMAEKEDGTVIDWASMELEEALEEHCALDSEVLEDEDGEEDDVLSIEMEIPMALVDYIQEDESRLAAFADWILRTEVAD